MAAGFGWLTLRQRLTPRMALALTIGAGGALQISAIVSGTGAGLTLTSAGATTLGAISVSGNLSLTSTGAVTQTDNAASVGGSTTILAIGRAVTLGHTSNEFGGMVAVTGSSITLVNRNALQATLTASDDVALSAASVQVSGATSGASSDLSIVSAGQTVLGALAVGGVLNLKSAGAISQTAAVRTGGAMTIDAVGQSVVLSQTANQIGGDVKVSAGAVSIRDASALKIELAATGVSSVSSGGALEITGSADGSSSSLALSATGALTIGALNVGAGLTASSTGAVSQTGVITTGGASRVTATGQTVTLNNAANEFRGTLSIAGSTVAVRDATALQLELTATGNVNVASGGALTVAGAVSGTSSVALASGAETVLGMLSVGGSLSVTSPGPVSQTGSGVKVGTTTTISATGQAVTLGAAANDFVGAVSVSGSAVTLRDSNALVAVLAASDTSSISAGAALTISGAVSGEGKGLSLVSGAATVLGALTVPGAQSVTAEIHLHFRCHGCTSASRWLAESLIA
ncbi:MAG: hypothetical protein EB027_06305 [Actinobacteria bacterium]|nr:hypothetical protein [Actinomycetota bacterium]